MFGKKLDENRKYFITSDLHFHHYNIIKFCPKTRPWGSREEMNEALIAEWNSVVGEDDVVFHIGDFCFGGGDKTRGIIERLNGTIIFVMGNHDKTVRNQVSSPNKFDYLEVRYKGTKVCMFHYPISEWNGKHRGSIMLHGHQHGRGPKYTGRIMDVGYDALGNIKRLDSVVEKMLRVAPHTERDAV